MAAWRRSLPRNQYHCPNCGGRHVHGSQRARDCGSSGAPSWGRASRAWSPPSARRPTARPRTSTPTRWTPRIPEPRPSADNADRRQPIERSGGGGGRRDRRAHARRRLSDPPTLVDKALLAQVFRPDSLYEQLADKLITNSGWRRWGRSHWLCTQLKDTAESLDPDLFAKQAGQSVRDGLRALGFPRYMADALGAGSGATVQIAFGTTSADSLSKLLRVLIPLVCPDFARCPAERAVVRTLVTPAISDEVRAMVQG